MPIGVGFTNANAEAGDGNGIVSKELKARFNDDFVVLRRLVGEFIVGLRFGEKGRRERGRVTR